MAEYPQKTSLKVQMRGIHFGSQITHLEESTKTNHPLNRTLVKIDTNSLGKYRRDPRKLEYLRSIRGELGETLSWVSSRFDYDIGI